MADTKLSALSAASALDGSELVYLAQGSSSVKETLAGIAQFDAASGFCYLNADYTLTSTTSSQKLFNTTTNGTLTLPQTGLYLLRAMIYLTTMSATSGNGVFSIIGAGSATLAGQLMQAVGIDATTPATAATQTGATVQGANAFTTNMHTAGTGTAMASAITGIFKCTATGTIIPSIALTTANAAVVKAGSWITIENIADASVYTRGSWS